MDKDEKIAFGIMAAVIVVQGITLRRVRKSHNRVVDAINNHAGLLNVFYQQEIDKMFTNIVEHFDE